MTAIWPTETNLSAAFDALALTRYNALIGMFEEDEETTAAINTNYDNRPTTDADRRATMIYGATQSSSMRDLFDNILLGNEDCTVM
jgi:hypothetical protein